MLYLEIKFLIYSMILISFFKIHYQQNTIMTKNFRFVVSRLVNTVFGRLD